MVRRCFPYVVAKIVTICTIKVSKIKQGLNSIIKFLKSVRDFIVRQRGDMEEVEIICKLGRSHSQLTGTWNEGLT